MPATLIPAPFAPLLPLASTAPGLPGDQLPLLALLPFVLLLLAIALMPLAAPHFWESNRNKGLVSAALSLPFATWLVLRFGPPGAAAIQHSMFDYLSFMALLGSLFVISGGIYVRGSLAGTPLSNSAFLAIGAVLANLIGTTGASMVLLRPFLRANEKRHDRVHQVVFFVFVVSNCGGLLTPLGDPPLFLGFLKGVPFDWTLRLWPQWLLVNGLLVLIFNFLDQWRLGREEKERGGAQFEELLEHEPLAIEGKRNLFFLLGVILVILANGQGWGTAPESWPFGLQEGMMVALALASLQATPARVREANRFGMGPIVEVAVLFAGIFVTMIAPLVYLNARGPDLGVERPWQYFWASGLLSSFLDNAPTYLTFGALAAGQAGVSVAGEHYLAALLARGTGPEAILVAISCGAVLMGAITYIGNGPNFMVKAIAEENGIRMPSFFGYMRWSVGVLIPIFLLVTLLFFR
jgi:Na+/H+ antiporter NhaD/arsenite permease-like protein